MQARLIESVELAPEVRHFVFEAEGAERLDFLPGQFVSLTAPIGGKLITRAYSLASAPQRGNCFELCLNRVPDGLFSNVLFNMKSGDTVAMKPPLGMFTLRQPPRDSLFIATGTGIAPMLAFVQHLFPDNGEDRSNSRDIWLVYGTRYETEIYYQKYFERIAAERHNFRYVSTLSRAKEGWEGLRGYVQDHVARILDQRDSLNHSGALPTAAEGTGFDIHAYICGLNDMVSGNRDRLTERGWQRKQIIFERYD